MKLLIISTGFINSNHAGGNVVAHARALRFSKKIQVTHAAFGKTSNYYQYSLGEYNKKVISIIYAWAIIIKLIIKIRPCRVEIHNIPLGIISFIFFRRPKIDYFYHGPAVDEAKIEHKSFVRILVALLLENLTFIFVNKILSISPFFINNYLKKNFLAKDKIYYRCAKVVFSEAVAEPLLNSINYKYFICCRRLVHRTGVDLLLRAFKIAYDKGMSRNIKLIIVGEGEQKSFLLKLATKLKLNNEVTFMSRVSESDKFNLYRNSLANVVPSRALEGFGVVLLESAFFGVPSIVTDVDNMPWVINELNGIGLISKPTPSGIAANLIKFNESMFNKKELSSISRRKFGVKT